MHDLRADRSDGGARDGANTVLATVVDLIHRRVEATPFAIAASQHEDQMSYAEVWEKSGSIACALADAGVSRGDLVGVLLERTPVIVPVLLGILRAGMAYLPLDNALPRERLEFIARDAGLAAIFVDAEPGFDLDPAVRRLSARNTVTLANAFVDRAPDLESSAYVIYTSGSTGKPKGVRIGHRALANFIAAFRDLLPLRDDDVLGATTTLSFDIAALELFLPLTFGARVAITPAGVAADPFELRAFLREEGCTVMQATPSSWRMLVDSGWTGPLRLALSGGEDLPLALAQAVRDRVDELWNLFGPTETTIWSAAKRLDPPIEKVTIGKPIENTRLYVLDDSLVPVPPAVVGELYIAGLGLADGYVKRPALTAERFVPDPFGLPGTRMYRTGDLVRRRSDSEVVFVGRADFQVKLRGFRIELDEIRAVLLQSARVADAAVTLVDAEPDPYLAALVRPKIDTESDRERRTGEMRLVAELGESLRRWLPEHMVPAKLVIVDDLPRTPNGKLDRKALADRARAAEPVRASSRVPATSDERAIVSVWSELLGHEVGANDDFFEAGGHSLVAARAVGRLRELRGADISVRDIFDHPTAELLACVLATAPSIRQDDRTAIVPRPRGAPSPLSFGQERLWFLEQLAPGSLAYLLPYAWFGRGRLSSDALEQALQAVAERHEPLRTGLSSVAGVARGRQFDPARLALERERLQVPVGRREALACELAAAEAARPLPPDGLPVRARLVELGGDDWVFLLSVHHHAFDGVSERVFARELSAVYQERTGGPAARLPPLEIGYGDYAAWQRTRHAEGAFADESAWWQARLEDAVPLELPFDRPRPSQPRFRGAHVEVDICGGLRPELERLAHACGASLYMTLLTAFQLLLARYSGQTDVCVATPVDGRARPALDPLIGFFVNTLILRGQIDPSDSFATLLRHSRDQILAALEHKDLPFEQLVSTVGPERDARVNPLAQVFFTLWQDPAAELELGGSIHTRPLQTRSPSSRFDLELEIRSDATTLSGTLTYNPDLFEADTVDQIGRHFGQLLHAVTTSPDAPVSTHSLLSFDEQRVLLDHRVATRPSTRTALRHLHRQAAETPGAPAVVQNGKHLTYAELLRRAQLLAGELAARGVGRGDIVGLACRRSLALPWAVLGILEAGAAVSPLDATYPRERLQQMIDTGGLTSFVVDEASAPSLPPALRAGAFVIDEEGTLRGRRRFSARPRPDDVAYVVFTSGSTGRPKAVAMPHSALANLIDWQRAQVDAARTLQFASISFDVSFQEMFSTWATGGALVIPDDETRRDLIAVAELVDDAEIERIFVPFAVLNELAEIYADLGRFPRALREVITAGEQLRVTPAIARLFRMTGATLENHYGPSETHLATAHKLTGDPSAWPALPPIGVPIANVAVFVVDDFLSLVPPGVVGEICIAGHGLAHGYAGDEPQTREHFVQLQLPDGTVTRVYRTGDRGRRRRDGVFEYVGRADAQVKVRGYRVEPAEVERVLADHPAVRGAAVLPRSVGGRTELVAYVGGQPQPEVVRAFLSSHVPEYMVPAHVIALSELPKTANGKLDRNALPAPTEIRPARLLPADEEELSELAAQLKRVWEEVLGQNSLGLDDNLFRLGGQSMVAARLAARLSRTLGRRVPVSMVFDAPTIRQMEIALRRAGLDEAPAAPPAARTTVHAPAFFPVTPQQRSVLEIHRVAGERREKPPFNLSIWAFRIRGVLDRRILREALDELVDRHEGLRARFSRSAGGEVTQSITARARVALPECRIDAPSHAERLDQVLLRSGDVAARQFGLDEVPRLRPTLFDLGDDDAVLSIVFDHLVSDDTSGRLFAQELFALYDARRAGRPSPLPAVEKTYHEFVLEQDAFVNGPLVEPYVDYWRRKLAPSDLVPVVELPQARHCAPPYGYGRSYETSLDAKTCAELAELAGATRTTPFMTTLMALLVQWAAYTERPVPITARTANRASDEETLFAYTSHVVVYRVPLERELSLREALVRVRDEVGEIRRYERVPHAELTRRMLGGRRWWDRVTPSVDLSVVEPYEPPRVEGLVLERLTLPDPIISPRTLAFSLPPDAERFAIRLEIASGLLDSDDAQDLVEDVRHVLETLAHAPRTTVAEVGLRLRGRAARAPFPVIDG